jgi:hypothetical protein
MKVSQRELLVGTVRVVIVLTPSEKQYIGVLCFMELGNYGDRSAFARVDRCAAKRMLDGTRCGRYESAFQRHDNRWRSVKVAHFDFYTGWGNFG